MRALASPSGVIKVSDEEAFNGAVRKLKAERKLSVSGLNGLLNEFAPEDMFGPTRVSSD